MAQMVGMRACYLFSRLAKTLRASLRPLLPDVLQRLQPHLASIVAHPLPDTSSLAKGAQGMSPSQLPLTLPRSSWHSQAMHLIGWVYTTHDGISLAPSLLSAAHKGMHFTCATQRSGMPDKTMGAASMWCATSWAIS